MIGRPLQVFKNQHNNSNLLVVCERAQCCLPYSQLVSIKNFEVSVIFVECGFDYRPHDLINSMDTYVICWHELINSIDTYICIPVLLCRCIKSFHWYFTVQKRRSEIKFVLQKPHWVPEILPDGNNTKKGNFKPPEFKSVARQDQGGRKYRIIPQPVLQPRMYKPG